MHGLYTASCLTCGPLDAPKPIGEAADTAERHRTLTHHDTRITITTHRKEGSNQ